MDLSDTGTIECRSYLNLSKIKWVFLLFQSVFNIFFFFKAFSLFLFQRKNDLVRTF